MPRELWVSRYANFPLPSTPKPSPLDRTPILVVVRRGDDPASTDSTTDTDVVQALAVLVEPLLVN